jgi:hypothetical protein
MSLFYFFTIVFILWEFNTLIFTKSYNQFLESSIKRLQTQQVTTDDVVFSFFNLGYFVWTILGLFTNQWMFFLLLLVLGIVSATFMKRFKIDSNLSNILTHRRIDAILSIIILLNIWFNCCPI